MELSENFNDHGNTTLGITTYFWDRVFAESRRNQFVLIMKILLPLFEIKIMIYKICNQGELGRSEVIFFPNLGRSTFFTVLTF